MEKSSLFRTYYFAFLMNKITIKSLNCKILGKNGQSYRNGVFSKKFFSAINQKIFIIYVQSKRIKITKISKKKTHFLISL